MQYCDGFCHQHESAAFMLASGHVGLEVKILYSVSYTVLLSKVHKSTSTCRGCTHGTIYTRHTRANLHDWTCRSPSLPLKVHNLNFACSGSYCTSWLLSYFLTAVPQSYFRSSHKALKFPESPLNKTVSSIFRVLIFFINNGQFASMIPGKGK